MAFVYVKFNRQKNISPATYTTVNTWADLPLASLYPNRIFVVLTSTGVPLINRKLSGMWRSDGANWNYIGLNVNVFLDTEFQVYRDANKSIKFDLQSATGNFTAYAPTRDFTLDRLEELGTTTDIEGIIKGRSGLIETAVAGIDFEPPILKNTAFNRSFETVATEIKMDGVQFVGASTNIPRADHVHPSDTSRVDKVSDETISGIKRFSGTYTRVDNNLVVGAGSGAIAAPTSNLQLQSTKSMAHQPALMNQVASGSLLTSSAYAISIFVTAPSTYLLSSGDAILGRRKLLMNRTAFRLTIQVESGTYLISNSASYYLEPYCAVELIFDSSAGPNSWRVCSEYKNIEALGITLPKTSGLGIKVDPAAPTYPWADLLGQIFPRVLGPSAPSRNTYRGIIDQWQFSVGDYAEVEFHIPHDYVPNSDIYIHAHWSHTSSLVTSGLVTWQFNVEAARGHNQEQFADAVVVNVAQTAPTGATGQYRHMIAEVQLSSSTPSASQINNSLLEPDSLILVKCFLNTNTMTGTPEPFLHYIDIHYQSTNIGTKQKAPNFYT